MPTASGHTKAIAASRVIGAKVFTNTGDEIGEVGDVILDKTADRIMFAVIARGGALVATGNFYPVPWSLLDYDETREAYVVPLSRDDFAKVPVAGNPFDMTADDGIPAQAAAAEHFGGATRSR